MATSRGGRGRGRACPLRTPFVAVAVGAAGVPVVCVDGATRTPTLKSRGVHVDERDIGGGRTDPLQDVGNTMTETRNDIAREEEMDSLWQPTAPEQGRDLAERYLPDRGASSLDEDTDQAYALRERMTLLQSEVELVHAQLSQMRSGRASKDVYARVFVPLMREFEETSRQYRAITAKDTQRRQEERQPAAPTRRHRRSTSLQLHRSVNLSG